MMSTLSYADHKTANYKLSSRKMRISLCLASFGFVFGLIVIFVGFVLYSTYRSMLASLVATID